jgi:hypothetical protein
VTTGPARGRAYSALIAAVGPTLASGVLALQPANPRYFLWRGKPTVLVGFGEHYGAVLIPNPDSLPDAQRGSGPLWGKPTEGGRRGVVERNSGPAADAHLRRHQE